MSKKIFVPALALLFVLPLSALAATGTAPLFGRVATTTPGSSASAGKAVKGALARCPIVESKIQVKVTSFDNMKMKHLTVYANLKERIAKVADRLTARGVDVAALRASLAVLDQKIAKFNADYASYIAKLRGIQESACGKSQGEFMAKLKEVKVALQWVHRDAADIRNYVNTVIKAEINSIRNALKGPSTTTTSTADGADRTTTTDKSVKIKPLVPALPQVD